MSANSAQHPPQGTFLTVERHQDAVTWNAFIPTSGAHFMFNRQFMDYHSDRFEDFSLVVRQGEAVVALFPANRSGDSLISHGGLSFGGLLYNPMSPSHTIIGALDAVTRHARDEGFQSIIYKRMPCVYTESPLEADAFALHRLGYSLFRRDLSSTLSLCSPPRLKKGRKHALGKARKANLRAAHSEDYEGFTALLAATLAERHGIKPVHTAAEIRLLSSRFPKNTLLLEVSSGGRWLAGGWLFITPRVCHTQYLAASAEGRATGAMDVVVLAAIEAGMDRGCSFLSFGISTEEEGRVLNEGLLAFKESFGATAICHDHYRIDL